MPAAAWPPTVLLFFVPFASLVPHVVLAASPTYIEQSFFFDYNIATQPVAVPVTAQCDTIHLEWSRNSATGPNPQAPYSLQIYTSTYVVPFLVDAGSDLTFDWQVPFAPGTLYQICMWDTNGATGGCQNIYSVIESNNTSCNNVTFPVALDVEANVSNGPMSQYGWINSCTDIAITPKNGTPPYTFTAAATLHPPFNVTSSDSTFNWTIALAWAQPFFVSVVDSQGSVWAQGPLHGGGPSVTSCLDTDPGTILKSSSGISAAVIAGATVAALVAGTLLGATGATFWRRKSKNAPSRYLLTKQNSFDHDMVPSHYQAPSASYLDSEPTLLNRLASDGTQYTVEPFVLPATTEDGRIIRPPSNDPACLQTASSSEQLERQSSGNPPGSRGVSDGSRAVYVVHHDAGRAPVTVYAEDGTQVVELPPEYYNETSAQQQTLRAVNPDPRNEVRSNRQDMDALLNPPRQLNRPSKSPPASPGSPLL